MGEVQKNENSYEDDVWLNDVWKLRFHDPFDDDWTHQSYISLTDVGSVIDFWNVHNIIKEKYKQGMFFLMRESIFPSWDDPANVTGGQVSIKILKENVATYVEEICISMLGENLLREEYKHDWAVVNGISLSAKRYFSILKIWVSNCDYNEIKFFNLPENHHGDIIFRPSIDNIQHNHENGTDKKHSDLSEPRKEGHEKFKFTRRDHKH